MCQIRNIVEEEPVWQDQHIENKESVVLVGTEASTGLSQIAVYQKLSCQLCSIILCSPFAVVLGAFLFKQALRLFLLCARVTCSIHL